MAELSRSVESEEGVKIVSLVKSSTKIAKVNAQIEISGGSYFGLLDELLIQA